MEYRRFGRTDLRMPVLTCGGMRFQQSWSENSKDQKVDPESQANVEATIQRAFELGINHFETARGYGMSERQLGMALTSLPREQVIVQTKVGPRDSEAEFLKEFDVSLENLQVDYVDLLAIHGINSHQILENVLRRGTLSACRKLQDRGLVRHVGFSTHGPTDSILAAVQTDEFSYINLHWYYFDQINWPAVLSASERDMGVFIISPSDKADHMALGDQRCQRAGHVGHVLMRRLVELEIGREFALGRRRRHEEAGLGVLRRQLEERCGEFEPVAEDQLIALFSVPSCGRRDVGLAELLSVGDVESLLL